MSTSVSSTAHVFVASDWPRSECSIAQVHEAISLGREYQHRVQFNESLHEPELETVFVDVGDTIYRLLSNTVISSNSLTRPE